MTVPPQVVAIRRSLCEGQCKADPTDPCNGCENGHWGAYVLQGCEEVQAQDEPGLGDKIAKFATPIARALGLDCIDPKTNELKPTSPCAKMKARLNEGMSITEAMKLRLQGK